MAKKYIPAVGSSASMFEKRGNPWVSAREGREKYGRRENENPDVDKDWLAKRQEKEDVPLVVKRKKEEPKPEDKARRRAAIAVSLHVALNNQVVVPDTAPKNKTEKFFSKGKHDEIARSYPGKKKKD